MSPWMHKEANRLHWLVKGHLIPEEWRHDERQVMSTYNSYMTRLWGNCERAEYGEIGFEAAWKKREAQDFMQKK